MKHQSLPSILKTILGQILVEDDASFHIKGKPFRVAQRTPYQKWTGPMQNFGANPGDAAGKRSALVAELSRRVYNVFYTPGNPAGEWLPAHKDWPQAEKDAFMDQLSAANQTEEGWDYWWAVSNIDPQGTVTVQKNNTFRTLVPNEWQPATTLDGPLALGMMVHLRCTKENRKIQTVFYYVNAQELMPYGAQIGRFYFNLKPAAAASLVKGLTTLLNAYRIPFSFKCLNHANYYDRSDNAVLYIEKHRFAIVARLLKQIVKGLDQPLNAAVPLFSHAILPGLSFAEDPGDGRSFGMSWSDILAEAAVRTWEKGIHSPAEAVNICLALCKEKGIAIDAPWRRPNSFMPYDFKLVSA